MRLATQDVLRRIASAAEQHEQGVLLLQGQGQSGPCRRQGCQGPEPGHIWTGLDDELQHGGAAEPVLYPVRHLAGGEAPTDD